MVNSPILPLITAHPDAHIEYTVLISSRSGETFLVTSIGIVSRYGDDCIELSQAGPWTVTPENPLQHSFTVDLPGFSISNTKARIEHERIKTEAWVELADRKKQINCPVR